MKSYPQSDEVLTGLGDKVIDGLSMSVVLAKADLQQHRTAYPSWVADYAERTLACLIHDRIWAHALVQLDKIDGVAFVDNGTTREIFAQTTFRMRVKRHAGDGSLSTYPTQTALEFYLQPETLPGLEEIRLAVGYEWNRRDRTMGAPVLSLRDGLDNPIWIVPLPVQPVQHAAGVRELPKPPQAGEPTAPDIRYDAGADEAGEESGRTS